MIKELGARIRAARERLHMSQAALLEIIGDGNQSTVASRERGRYGCCTVVVKLL